MLILLWVSLMWSHQEPIFPKQNLRGDKTRSIPPISLKIVLMVPIWTLSNPFQCLTSPEKSINNSDGTSWLMMYQNSGRVYVDQLCQLWFRKLIVSYLHRFLTFSIKTTRSEYAIALYYQTLVIVPQFGTFVPGSLYIKRNEIQNRALRVV